MSDPLDAVEDLASRRAGSKAKPKPKPKAPPRTIVVTVRLSLDEYEPIARAAAAADAKVAAFVRRAALEASSIAPEPPPETDADGNPLDPVAAAERALFRAEMEAGRCEARLEAAKAEHPQS